MITIKELTITYKETGREALRSVSFAVQPGERVAILGPSGCGKTTLLHAIAGLLEDEAAQVGSIKIAKGVRMGMVFQRPTLLPWRTVTENIAYGNTVSGTPRDRSMERTLVAMVGLSGVEKNYPHQLSLGMQQRVNFARALARRPDVLLMDEPFTGLDVGTKKGIQEEFKRILEERHMTTVFVTHSLSEASFLADRIVILSAGPGMVKAIVPNKGVMPEDITYQYMESDEE